MDDVELVVTVPTETVSLPLIITVPELVEVVVELFVGDVGLFRLACIDTFVAVELVDTLY